MDGCTGLGLEVVHFEPAGLEKSAEVGAGHGKQLAVGVEFECSVHRNYKVCEVLTVQKIFKKHLVVIHLILNTGLLEDSTWRTFSNLIV